MNLADGQYLQLLLRRGQSREVDLETETVIAWEQLLVLAVELTQTVDQLPVEVT